METSKAVRLISWLGLEIEKKLSQSQGQVAPQFGTSQVVIEVPTDLAKDAVEAINSIVDMQIKGNK